MVIRMDNWEEKLSPLARERLARVGEMTKEEKERMKDAEELRSLLAEFYSGEVDPEGVWQRLGGYKPSLLREAQLQLIDTLASVDSPAETQRRNDAILAIETLKEVQNTSAVEQCLASIDGLNKRSEEELGRAYSLVISEVEGNPQLRIKQVPQGQGTQAIQLSVEEAVRELPHWQEFVSQHGKKHRENMSTLIEKLKAEVK